MERQLTEGRPFGVLLQYALPVLGGNLFQLFCQPCRSLSVCQPFYCQRTGFPVFLFLTPFLK